MRVFAIEKKFLFLGLIMSAILVINHILWSIKNTLIVHAAGAEALSLLKLIGTLPCALVVTLIYAKLSHHFSRKELFSITLFPFFIFFFLFAFAIYPYREALHPSREWIESVSSAYPRWHTLVHLIGNWSFALFYIVAEMWPSVGLALLFWQLANDTTSLQEAERFYPLFGLVSNIAIVCAGAIVYQLSISQQYLGTLQSLVVIIALFGVMIFFFHKRIFLLVAPTINKREEDKSDEEKPSLSFKASIQHLFQSKQLALLALIVICFGIAQKIMESMWQDQLRILHPTQNGYSACLGTLSWISGIGTFSLMLISTFLLRHFRSSQTPFYFFSCVLLLATCCFFCLVIFTEAPLFTVWIGSLQDILNKVTKTSFCDPVKEMSYIPLDPELKVKGKAAVDVAADRFGKHGGALVQQFFLLTTAGTLSQIAPFLAVVSLAAICVWLFAIAHLGKRLHHHIYTS